jgi:hypothetical protein
MARPFKNFDEFIAEVNVEPIEFQFRGEQYLVKGTISFITKLRLAKLFSKKSKQSEISAEELYEVTTSILGDDNVHRLEQAGVSQEEYMMIMEYVNSAYQEDEEDTTTTSPKEKKTPRGKSPQTQS